MKKNTPEPAFQAPAMTFEVMEAQPLLEYLFKSMPDKSRTTVKSYLTHRQVYVNDRVTTRFDLPLKPHDRVAIKTGKGYNECRSLFLKVVFEDEYLIIIDKKPGLLSIATNRAGEKTAYQILSQHVKNNDPRDKIFVIHRLDRETSGLMMFAKNPDIQIRMQENWENAVIQRKYTAVVEGKPAKTTGTLRSFLVESSALKVYTAREDNGKLAITHYKCLRSNDLYTLVELELETGRKHQIRVQMKEIGHPVSGDKKYGDKNPSPINRLALHAHLLHFVHPVTGKEMRFESPVPQKFQVLLKGNKNCQ